MDGHQAKLLFEKLAGSTIEGWTVSGFSGSGKSAAVLKVERAGKIAALKIFDPALVERFGKDVQLARIERERTLIGHHHPNLVQILGGGETKEGLLYVLMEYVDAPTLDTVLAAFPRSKIFDVVSQVAGAAKFLEDLSLAHRDIKPDNIAISTDFGTAKLLDLGVLRPIVGSDVTDQEQKEFVGTLRYSSPEFLFRVEEDNPDGWRALTIYQLGCVLHDLIMRRRIFSDVDTPYARLVEAVKNDKPLVEAPDALPDLILLARNCLLKDAKQRSSLVTWDNLRTPPKDVPDIGALTVRIRRRRALMSAQSEESREQLEEEWDTHRQFDRLLGELTSTLQRECIGTGLFPPVEIRQHTDVPASRLDLELRFDKSVNHNLPLCTAMVFDVAVLDLKEQVVEVKSGVCVLKDYGDDLPPTSKGERKAIFKGVYEPAIVRQRMQEELLRMLDALQTALEQPKKIVGKWIPTEDPKGAA
jgi:eukaryotic-like serine/threonine-protein kinase